MEADLLDERESEPDPEPESNEDEEPALVRRLPFRSFEPSALELEPADLAAACCVKCSTTA